MKFPELKFARVSFKTLFFSGNELILCDIFYRKGEHLNALSVYFEKGIMARTLPFEKMAVVVSKCRRDLNGGEGNFLFPK